MKSVEIIKRYLAGETLAILAQGLYLNFYTVISTASTVGAPPHSNIQAQGSSYNKSNGQYKRVSFLSITFCATMPSTLSGERQFVTPSQ